LVLVKPHLREPVVPILRAQTLPVRSATLASHVPHIEPVISPSYSPPPPPGTPPPPQGRPPRGPHPMGGVSQGQGV
jgi:hypothetical protein